MRYRQFLLDFHSCPVSEYSGILF